MYIQYHDDLGESFVACIAPGVTIKQAAEAMGLAPGTWREISESEAAELQKPTPEEIAAARRPEILGRLAAIDAESVRPLRAKVSGTSTPEDDATLAALEQEAGALRVELAGLSDG